MYPIKNLHKCKMLILLIYIALCFCLDAGAVIDKTFQCDKKKCVVSFIPKKIATHYHIHFNCKNKLKKIKPGFHCKHKICTTKAISIKNYNGHWFRALTCVKYSNMCLIKKRSLIRAAWHNGGTNVTCTHFHYYDLGNIEEKILICNKSRIPKKTLHISIYCAEQTL